MALPPGLTPKTVTVGIASFTDGSLASGTATITAPVNLVHTPTNRPIFSSSMTQPFVDGAVTFTLLPTDAPGLNRFDWTYKLNVQISGALVQPDPIWFTLPTAGPDTIDLDGLVTVPSSAGVPISVDVLTINDITNPASDVSTALKAAFGSADPAGYDIFVLAGQSNMSGYSEAIPNAAVTDPPNTRITQWGTHGTLGIKPATEPLDMYDTPTGIGPGLQFARWYVSRRPASQRKVLLVPVAKGGTPFEGVSGPAGWTWKIGRSDVTNLYTNLVTQALAAKTAADATSGTVNAFRGLLWLQGESDGDNLTSGSTYRTDLDAMLNQVRVDLGVTDLPIVIGTMVPEYLGTGTRAAINAVHRSTPYRITRCSVAIGATGMNKGDGNHYSIAGQRANGKTFADAYEALLQGIISGATDYTPGQVTGLSVTSASSTSLTAAWSTAANATSYLVEYRATGAGSWTTSGTVTVTSATITGLATGQSYDVRVTSKNILGDTAAPSVTATGSPATPPPPAVSDTFTRANSTTALGTADTGQTWTAGVGTYGIASNAAYSVTAADGDRVIIDAGITDQKVTVTVTAGTPVSGNGPSPSVLARMSDASNGYVFNVAQNLAQAKMFKVVAGSYTQIGSTYAMPSVLADGQTIGLSAKGSTVTAYINGAAVIATTDTTFTTGTKAGLRVGALSSALRYDNFTVEAV